MLLLVFFLTALHLIADEGSTLVVFFLHGLLQRLLQQRIRQTHDRESHTHHFLIKRCRELLEHLQRGAHLITTCQRKQHSRFRKKFIALAGYRIYQFCLEATILNTLELNAVMGYLLIFHHLCKHINQMISGFFSLMLMPFDFARHLLSQHNRERTGLRHVGKRDYAGIICLWNRKSPFIN